MLDEPTSSLDPLTTESIEALLKTLTPALTLIVVTHNLGQALRVSHHTMFFYQGQLMEYGPTDDLFNQPTAPRHRALRHGTDGVGTRPGHGDVPARPRIGHQSATPKHHTNHLTRREPVKTPMRARHDSSGELIVAAVAGLALSSVVISSAASASVKLPKSGVETPSGGTVTETGSTLLYPLFNLWAGGYNAKYPSVTIQTAGTGSGTGISEAENGTIDIGASDAYLSPSVVSANPDLQEHPAGDLGPAGRLQHPGRPLAPEAEREGALGDLPGPDHQVERLGDRRARTRASRFPPPRS